MASPTKQSRADTQGSAGRRSTRLAIPISVAISGKDAGGKTFKENTRTIVINKHGAKISSAHQLTLGTELSVENRALGVSAKTNVVWLGDKKSPKDAGEIGVQLREAGNIWGVEFPPEDWQEGAPTGPGGQRLDPPAAVAPPQSKAQSEIPLSARNDKLGGPAEIETREAEAASGSATSKPATTSARKETSPQRAVEKGGELSAEVTLPSTQTGAATEKEAAAFEARLAKISSQAEVNLRHTLQEMANNIEEKMVKSLEQHFGTLEERLQLFRIENDQLQSNFKDLQRGSQKEIDETQYKIKEASRQTVKSATEEMSEALRAEMETATGKFVEEMRKRARDEASAVMETLAKEAETRLAKISKECVADAEGDLQALQKRAVDQAASEVSKAAEATATSSTEKLQHEADALEGHFEAQLEKAVRITLEKGGREIQDHVRKTAGELADDLLAAAGKDLQKQSKETRAVLEEELKSTGKSLTEDAKKRLTALTNATVESLNKEGNAGLEEFRSHLRKAQKEFEIQGAKDLEAHLEETAEKNRERMRKQLQKDTDEAAEQAVAQLHSKVEGAVKEASDTVNKHVGSGAVFLKELEEQGKSRIEGHSRKIEESGKNSVEAAQKQMGELSVSAAESIRQSAETLVENFREELRKAAVAFQDKTMEEINVRLQKTSEKLVEDSTARLNKQSEENLALVSGQLNEKKEQMVNEAEEAFRTKLSEVFSSALQPGAKKSK